MKKIFITLFFVFAVFLFAEQKITVLSIGDVTFADGSSLFNEATKMLKKDFPDAKVVILGVDQVSGSTITMDSLLAAGEPPNVYYDSQVRTGKYLVPEYALDLTNEIRDISKVNKSMLAPFTKNGKVLGLPMPGSSQGMFINLDIMKDIGYTVPNDWTISDFLKMAELVKQKYGGKKFATGMFAANQSGDYLNNNWFAAFGVPFYENGNYDKPVMADKGGAKVYEFYQTLMKNGYITKDAASIGDEEFIVQWMRGDIAATAFFENWIPVYYDSAIKQGLITKAPKYTFVEFPRVPGVTKVPTYTNGYGVVVHKTGTPIDKVAARFVEYLNSAELQYKQAVSRELSPTRIDVNYVSKNVHILEIEKIVKENGAMDVGVSDPRFPERRATQFPILQKVLNLKITPEKAIAEYQDAMRKVK